MLDATGGTLDALYNNGAFAMLGAVEDVPTAGLRELFEANFFGWHTLTRTPTLTLSLTISLALTLTLTLTISLTLGGTRSHSSPCARCARRLTLEP